jgi:uncharacterized protein YdhG (YjbR/CyaY superfamily)
MTDTKEPTAADEQNAEDWTDEERAAMKERAKELKAARKKTGKVDPEAEMLAKIAELPDPDRHMAERIHAIITEVAPQLSPKLWYGMPAYAKAGKVVCFFTPASKFKERYASFGFNAAANLDDGVMWATSFALTELTADAEARIAELVGRAVG